MKELVNTSPLGDLEIVGVGLVEAGATFEAPDDVAESLIEQGFEPPGGIDPDDYPTWRVADLKAEIERRNTERPDGAEPLPTRGNKADLIAVLVADNAEEKS